VTRRGAPLLAVPHVPDPQALRARTR
jgi:hypothetical protein